MRIGIDIGGTKVLAGLIDEAGKVIFKKKTPTEKEKGYEGVRSNIIALIRTVIEEQNIDTKKIKRVGIASAGQIDKASTKILFSPNLGWHNVPLKDDIERACGVKTFIENDVNAAVYGEWKFGLKGIPDDIVGVFIGSGIGGGIIINKSLYRGFSYVGGEIGHMNVNPYGYKCNCGSTGCFEAYCGGLYIVERVRTEIKSGYRGKIWDIVAGNPDTLNTVHIEEARLLGDPLCRKVWKEVIEYLGVGLASLINLLNPEIVLLGGGVVNGSPYLVEEARTVMEARAMKASLRGVKIEKAQFGEDAGIVGAAFVE